MRMPAVENNKKDVHPDGVRSWIGGVLRDPNRLQRSSVFHWPAHAVFTTKIGAVVSGKEMITRIRLFGFGGKKRIWKTWKTVTLGTHKSVLELLGALRKNSIRIGDWADNFFCQPYLDGYPAATELDLVLVTNAQLGLKKKTTAAETFARAKELSLDLCPGEAVLQLRLQYKDQPCGEWLNIALDTFADSDANFHVFSITRDDDGLWVFNDSVCSGRLWSPDSRWVFIRSSSVLRCF